MASVNGGIHLIFKRFSNAQCLSAIKCCCLLRAITDIMLYKCNVFYLSFTYLGWLQSLDAHTDIAKLKNTQMALFHRKYQLNSPAFFCILNTKIRYLDRAWYFLVSPQSRFQESWSDTFVWRKQAAGHWLAREWRHWPSHDECEIRAWHPTPGIFKY